MQNQPQTRHDTISLTKAGPKQLYKKPGAILLTAVIVIVGALMALYMLQTGNNGQRINQDGFQVVYVTTGQAYFGKLQNTKGDYLVLKNPYSAQSVAPANKKTTDSADDTTLLKVSQQVYGPEDVISISSDQVLFWQNLRSDSKVATAIASKE